MRPAPTPLQRLRGHVRVLHGDQIANMAQHDQVLRGVAASSAATGGAFASVASAKVAAAAVAEEAAAYTALRWIGWRAAGARFLANAVGQGVGNYAVYGDAEVAVDKVNWVSPFLAAGGLPLITTSIGSAAFKVDLEQGYRSVLNGKVTGSMFVQDAALNYGFGQATRLSGFDDWFRSSAATSFVNETRYQASLRLSPRIAQGMGVALPHALETSNRAASGAVRKAGIEKTKIHLK